MVPRGPAQARGQATTSKPISRKVSDDSGAHLSASATSTINADSSLPMATTTGTYSPPHIPQLAPPVELVGATEADQARRMSRRVQHWLADQQRLNTSMNTPPRERVTKASGTPSNAYLAYPNLPNNPARKENDGDDESILRSFVVVKGNEKRGTGNRVPPLLRKGSNLDFQDGQASMERTAYNLSPHPDALATDSTGQSSSLRAPRPMSILSVSPWRNLPFTKTPPSKPAAAPERAVDLSTPPPTLRKSPQLHRRSPIPESFLDKNVPATPNSSRGARSKKSSGTLKPPETPRSSMKHRLGNFTRVHGHADSSSGSPGSKSPSSPRPSTSTSATTATTSTAVEKDMQSEPGGTASGRFLPKFKMSLSRPTRTTVDLGFPMHPTFSSVSVPSQSDVYLDPPPLPPFRSEFGLSPSLSRRPSQSSIFREKKHNVSSSALSTLSIGSIGSIATSIGERSSNVFTGSTTTKRKKLVVSGIEKNDTTAVEGLRRWCERFGELRQITRMPNGDLLIDFKRGDVADTVCRISARVHIAGVGSVHMSWISGKKR
ncbi:hypothetical protein DFH11DRAFT_1557117 [Phellopilus nigrolimitatus]|nr:hypothetical protein DFH11DRAFT_1557117 [Phellopilus nigrolimitatus]